MWVDDLRKTYFGDANLDGEFNSTDFVDVLGRGQYEDNIADNSQWEDGDWSGDGEFDSTDFVVALTAGGYEVGPRAAVASVPEPTGLILLASRPGAGRSTPSKCGLISDGFASIAL